MTLDVRIEVHSDSYQEHSPTADMLALCHTLVPRLGHPSALKMEAKCSFERLVDIQQTTRRHIPVGIVLYGCGFSTNIFNPNQFENLYEPKFLKVFSVAPGECGNNRMANAMTRKSNLLSINYSPLLFSFLRRNNTITSSVERA
jgi:hypothetical protein